MQAQRFVKYTAVKPCLIASIRRVILHQKNAMGAVTVMEMILASILSLEVILYHTRTNLWRQMIALVAIKEGDKDGILPSVLKQRFEGQVPENEW